MERAEGFVGIGQLQVRSKDSHPANQQYTQQWSNGLSKRELFAAMAMQAIIASGGSKITDQSYNNILCGDSVRIADDLIFELSQKGVL